jgi:rubrerythrin
MGNENLMELLDKAIKAEKEAIDLYLEIADSVKSPMLKALFKEYIAVQEMEHLHLLEDVKEKQTNGSCKIH